MINEKDGQHIAHYPQDFYKLNNIIEGNNFFFVFVHYLEKFHILLNLFFTESNIRYLSSKCFIQLYLLCKINPSVNFKI